jgi:hypothetical protein
MKMTLLKISTILLTSLLFQGALPGSTTVNFKIIENGKEKPEPREIRLKFGKRCVRVPLRDGRFAVSGDVLTTQSPITLEIDNVEGSEIRLRGLHGPDLTGQWTLRMSDRIDADYYDWPGPKKADIPRTCMLELDSGTEDPARVLFGQDCRKRRRR